MNSDVTASSFDRGRGGIFQRKFQTIYRTFRLNLAHINLLIGFEFTRTFFFLVYTSKLKCETRAHWYVKTCVAVVNGSVNAWNSILSRKKKLHFKRTIWLICTFYTVPPCQSVSVSILFPSYFNRCCQATKPNIIRRAVLYPCAKFQRHTKHLINQTELLKCIVSSSSFDVSIKLFHSAQA